jgi:hypothetical protein
MKPGKEMNDRIAQINWERPDFPGMHAGFQHGFQYINAGVDRLGDAVVFTWPLDAAVVTSQPWYNPRTWTPMKMSEFYALKESVDAETAIKVS